jgi:glutamyl-tRNA synthetase
MSKPRLRFAPSPTGYLHIGGVRTALFNWLWARKTGGTFVLRIEDTDRERSTPENEAVIIRDLAWLGLDWDEGPTGTAKGAQGGAFGPYRQMERLELYAEHADKLVASGAAYRCTCTKEELDRQREALKAEDPKATFRYPGTCRDKKLPRDAGAPWVLRLRAPSAGSVVYRDLVFGEVTTPNAAQQDAVLMRSDGVPLYNLGCVVDDVTMGITLVARGRDHMVNTPLQILLYEALGAKVPAFAHLPMMLAPDGQKLSKRHGAVSVGEYRDRGVPPAALLNYLVRFGWSFGDEEIFSMAGLVEKFDWERCSKADGKFDAKKLQAVSFEHLKRPELTDTASYARAVVPYLEARGLSGVELALLERAVPSIRERAETLVSAADWLDWLFRDEPVLDEKAAAKFLAPNAEAAELVSELASVVREVAARGALGREALEAAGTAWMAARGVELKKFAQCARVALTGRTASPGLWEVIELLGAERALARLEAGVARLRAGT